MRPDHFIVALLLFTIFNVRAQEKSKIDSLVFTEFYSEALQEKRRIVVHLPLNYSKEKNKRYPVMYVLDAGKLNFNIADRLFTLSSAGLTPECVVVGVLNGKGTRERDLTPPFMQTEVDDINSPQGKADLFLKFFEFDLIPLIDSCYRTSDNRTLSGHSRAGLFVLYSLIEYPELFSARFCYSTPAWRFDNVIIKQLAQSLKKHRLQKDCYLFFSIGEMENENIRASFFAMKKMLTQQHKKNLISESYITPLSDHQSNPVFSSSNALAGWSKFLSP